MKNYIILFLFTSLCFSQNYKSIMVTYKAVLEPIKIDPKNEHYNSLFEEMNQTLIDKSFILKVNSNGTLFEEEKKMAYDERKKKISDMASAGYSISNYSYDKERDKLFTITNNLNVISNHSYEWDLTSETKDIDNYTCYKATYIYNFITTKGKEVNRLITAWYTPDISFSYGPNGYMGLPGLILELEYDKTKLVAKEIQFFKEDVKIDFPKNREITEEEYLKRIKIN